jgi:hypothetical protein
MSSSSDLLSSLCKRLHAADKLSAAELNALENLFRQADVEPIDDDVVAAAAQLSAAESRFLTAIKALSRRAMMAFPSAGSGASAGANPPASVAPAPAAVDEEELDDGFDLFD